VRQIGSLDRYNEYTTQGDLKKMANISDTPLNKAQVNGLTEAVSEENNEAESSMGRANRLIREHRKRVEEKTSVAVPEEPRIETPIM